MSDISEVIVDCRIERACMKELDEVPRAKIRMASPFWNGQREVLIDGNWKSIPEKCLIEIQKR